MPEGNAESKTSGVPAASARTTFEDQDGDGVPDAVDKCPDDPEDNYDFENQDGCPDLDNDGDGIAGAKDKCPNDPEDKDEVEDEDGCPEKNPRVVIASSAHAIAPVVFFDKNQSKLRVESHGIVDEVIEELPRLPKPSTVLLEGRAASDEREPMKLSIARANAIKEYMLSKGIPPEVNLEVVGYGHTKPILYEHEEKEDVNMNRRVDFVLKK
jgi:outer membrane protein OmpA-like peptidoglycan-associated protein